MVIGCPSSAGMRRVETSAIARLEEGCECKLFSLHTPFYVVEIESVGFGYPPSAWVGRVETSAAARMG